MNRPRYQFLSRASFSQNAHPCLAGRHTLHLRHHALHGRALPHKFMLPESLLQLPVFAFQALQLQRILHSEQKFFRGDRFFQKVQRAQSCGSHCHFNFCLP